MRPAPSELVKVLSYTDRMHHRAQTKLISLTQALSSRTSAWHVVRLLASVNGVLVPRCDPVSTHLLQDTVIAHESYNPLGSPAIPSLDPRHLCFQLCTPLPVPCRL